MKPYKHIENQKKLINTLKYRLQYSKNKVNDAETINTLIDTVTAFESMMVDKYFTDSIETLLYTNIKYWLMKNEVYNGVKDVNYNCRTSYSSSKTVNKIKYENEIPLHKICKSIDFDLTNGSKQKKLEVISILKSHEIQNKIKSNSLVNKDFTNFDKLLTELVNEFKTIIKWKKLT